MMQYLREVQWQCYCKNSHNILFDKANDALVYNTFIDAQPRPDETPDVFFASNKKCSSYSGVRADFIGYYRDLKNPVAIEKGACGNTELKGGEAMFSMAFDFDLKAGKEETFNLFLGANEPGQDLTAQIKDLRNEDHVEELWNGLKKKWADRLAKFQVTLPDADSSRMMNTWMPLQALVNFYVCREISFYATGTVRGIGVRDASQDILANVLFDTEAAKEKIKLIMTQQYNSGKTNHYFYPIEKAPPVISDRSDNHLWMVYAVYYVLMEEGKPDFLNDVVEYYDGGEGTVLEHIEKSVAYCVDGLPLMLGSDWNDMLVNVCKKVRAKAYSFRKC